jgi:tetratricopeptide (TPR) repeat protein
VRHQLVFTAALIASPLALIHAQCTPAVQKLLSEQKFDDAKTELQPLLNRNASDDAALHCMGRVYVAMGKPGDAIDWFEKAVRANDNVSVHHLWLANALGEQAQHANKLKLPFMARRIKSEFDRAAQLDPTSIDARHGLIQFYSNAPGAMGGSMDKAREQAIEIEQLNAMRGHIEIASLLEHDNDPVGAEREYSAAVTASPDSAAGYTTLASFFRRHKRPSDAVTAYERLLKAKPDAVNARLNIGITLAQANQNADRAEREIRQWIEEAPKDASPQNVSAAHYFLGLVYERQSKRDAARTEYQTALAANPKNEDAKRALDALK